MNNKYDIIDTLSRLTIIEGSLIETISKSINTNILELIENFKNKIKIHGVFYYVEDITNNIKVYINTQSNQNKIIGKILYEFHLLEEYLNINVKGK
jgi:hypothetical protein